MRTVAIYVSDEEGDVLDRFAQEQGFTLEEFLESGVRARLKKVLMQSVRRWTTSPIWDSMVQGQECSICRDLEDERRENYEGFVVCDLGISRLRFMRNQFLAGYCVLTCLEHVREPYELSLDNRRAFFDDLMRVGLGVEEVFSPAKMNFEIQGNAVPHLHCHIKPRYRGDEAPGLPIDQNGRTRLLTDEEYETQVKAVREAVMRTT